MSDTGRNITPDILKAAIRSDRRIKRKRWLCRFSIHTRALYRIIDEPRPCMVEPRCACGKKTWPLEDFIGRFTL